MVTTELHRTDLKPRISEKSPLSGNCEFFLTKILQFESLEILSATNFMQVKNFDRQILRVSF